jgi:hypothetical protein
MQPGYPGQGEDPYGQQPPYSDPYAQPQYPPPAHQDPYAQPQQPYADPYAQPQPTSGNPYPTSGSPYPGSPGYPPPGYPPAQQYPVAGYGAPMQQSQTNVMAIIALVLGIVGIPLVCCYGIGAALGIAGIVLGLLGMKKAPELGGNGRGMALAGAICGGVAVLIAVGLWVLVFALGMGSFTYY